MFFLNAISREGQRRPKNCGHTLCLVPEGKAYSTRNKTFSSEDSCNQIFFSSFSSKWRLKVQSKELFPPKKVNTSIFREKIVTLWIMCTGENRRFDRCIVDWTNQCKSRLPLVAKSAFFCHCSVHIWSNLWNIFMQWQSEAWQLWLLMVDSPWTDGSTMIHFAFSNQIQIHFICIVHICIFAY